MSVLQKSRSGDRIAIIQRFNASPKGQPFAWATSRRFRVGEEARFVRVFQDQRQMRHPCLGWTVGFDAADGKRYAATQNYYVTDDCWRNLKRFLFDG
jgi:hypothetical protein